MRNRSETDQAPLIIDRAAAAEIPSLEVVREWAHGRRAFISSVMSELPTQRQAAAAAARAVRVALAFGLPRALQETASLRAETSKRLVDRRDPGPDVLTSVYDGAPGQGR